MNGAEWDLSTSPFKELFCTARLLDMNQKLGTKENRMTSIALAHLN